MNLWLALKTLRRAPRRLLLGALGVAFPVAMIAATLLFVNQAVNSMTRIALDPIQIEQRALATSLNVDMNAIGKKLKAIPGVSRVDRFAATDVVVRMPGTSGGATARLFAVDPSYIKDNSFVNVVSGDLSQGALLDQALRASPGFTSAKQVSIELPGGGRQSALTVPASGSVDLRQALPTWFAIPTGEVQGDVALVPRAIVIDYKTFERSLLPALKKQLGTTTPVLNPGLTDLPPASIEGHIAVDHSSFPSDPGKAAVWSTALRRVLERQAPGDIVVADDAFEPLTEAATDASNAKTMFLLLGIPGALVAAALGLAAQSALAEAHRREDALLRLRGATDRQLGWLAAVDAGIAGLLGSALGLLLGFGAVSVATGQLAWRDVPGSSLAFSVLVAVGVGVLTTAARLVMLVRSSRRPEVVERRVLERGWNPLWKRAGLDFVAIAVGGAILAINASSGGLKPALLDPGAGTVTLRFFILLAPLCLWLGVTLLAVRLLLNRSRRWTRPDRDRPLTSWGAAALRWLGRRPARTGVAVVLGALAVAFGTEVVTFVATYREAKAADDTAAWGSDLRLTPADPVLGKLPPLGPQVAATTPIRTVPVRAGTDRKTVMTVDLSSYPKATTAKPLMESGPGLDGLHQDAQGVLVSKEIATDFEVGPGDPLPLTIFPDDQDQSRNIKLDVIGVYRSFPPSEPPTEMVMSTAAIPSFLLPPPDFYLAKDTPGSSPGAVADELRNGAVRNTFSVATIADMTRSVPHSLTAVNLGPLGDIEMVGAALIAAIGVAVLGTFLVLERRREFAVLEAVGADASQIRTGPAQESVIAVLASIGIGVPVGLGLGMLSVTVLGLFFTLPPPLLSVPVGTLIGFVLLMAGTSAVAIGVALARVTRTAAGTVLREP
jgi:putative ABC transport system permease protein